MAKAAQFAVFFGWQVNNNQPVNTSRLCILCKALQTIGHQRIEISHQNNRGVLVFAAELSHHIQRTVHIGAVFQGALVRLCDRPAALLSLLNDERDHHHIQLFLNDLEPRAFCPRAVMEALDIFLACPGNRMDVYVPAGVPDLYYRDRHAFIRRLEQTAKAQLHEITPDPTCAEFMLGSHGQLFVKQEGNAGVLMAGDPALRAKLSAFFANLARHDSYPAPQPA